MILAVGISGIQQLGGAFFVEPLFNGVTLLVSIALAGLAQRRRSRTSRKPSIAGLEASAGAHTKSEDGDGEVSHAT